MSFLRNVVSFLAACCCGSSCCCDDSGCADCDCC